jgi:hypothetical protein
MSYDVEVMAFILKFIGQKFASTDFSHKIPEEKNVFLRLK